MDRGDVKGNPGIRWGLWVGGVTRVFHAFNPDVHRDTPCRLVTPGKIVPGACSNLPVGSARPPSFCSIQIGG